MEEKNCQKECRSLTCRMRENPWMAATIVLGVVTILLLIPALGMTGGVISEDAAGEKLLNYYSSNGATDLELQGVEEVNGLYMVTFLYQGTEVPVYMTKDGSLAGSMSALVVADSSSQDSMEVPTEDVPTADLFIWSYCPYGVTALSPFADVAELLGDAANLKVHLYYAGHGDYEEQQNKIQACIQEEAPELYWDYAKGFADEIYETCYGDVACDLEESTVLMNSLGIDSTSILSCVDSRGEDLLDEHYANAQAVGVTASPSLVVNGVKVSVARTAEAFKGAVCSGFNEMPSTCGEELDSTGTTATGSC